MNALARLRFRVSDTRGRRYPEPCHPYRNEFQRDRDRIVHARAFRRLEDKTQVFGSGISDHFRNRLTHTIEVVQVARTVAAVLGLNEDLTEALALAHDIGHPPFAHAGEEELDRQVRRFGDRFDHNLHALRIVETFERRYARFPGLNLTFEVREGLVKHSRELEPGQEAELDDYLPGLRPTLEAQLIDLADEIAYNTADLEDAFTASMFEASCVAEEVPEFAKLQERVAAQFPGVSRRIQFQEIVRSLMNALVSGLIEGTVKAASEAAVNTPDELRQHHSRLARLTEAAQRTNRELKRFLHEHVYFSADLISERARCAEMIDRLFQCFLEQPERMPENYREMAEEVPLHRVVCDYIAGMTDGFFRRCYREQGLIKPRLDLR